MPDLGVSLTCLFPINEILGDVPIALQRSNLLPAKNVQIPRHREPLNRLIRM
jgi:hypothetical protein